MVRQKAIVDLALQFDNACTTKDDLRKTYKKCNDIPQGSSALIDAFLKEGSDKDYDMHLSMYENAVKIKKQMNAKLAWLVEKYNYRSQIHIGGSSSQTHELCDVYLTEKELHLDENDLKETLQEQARDEKEREEKIRQKKAEDEEFMLEYGRKFDSDYDTRVEPSFSTPNPVRIISGLAGIVQQAKMLKEKVFILDSDGALMSTQEYMPKVVEDVSEDDDFKSGVWVSATNYVTATGGTITGCLGDIKNFLKKGKLDEVVAIVESCSPNDIGDLNVTMKISQGQYLEQYITKSLVMVVIEKILL
nr:hypothetical protein [Tanacetum cinerariifolium]